MRALSRRVVLLLALAALVSGPALVRGVDAAEQTVAELKEAPSGLSADVAAAIQETGYRISGPKGVICDLWLAKQIELKPKFKSTLQVKYPFQIGQLVGVIRFPDGSKPNDFRGQELSTGTYTLRYGLQPNDGNHLDTSPTRDFLVGCPPKDDVNPKRVEDLKKLFKLSTGASGTTHPATFLLIPPADKPFDAAAVRFDEEKHYVIFDANLKGKDAEQEVSWPLSVVTVGKAGG